MKCAEIVLSYSYITRVQFSNLSSESLNLQILIKSHFTVITMATKAQYDKTLKLIRHKNIRMFFCSFQVHSVYEFECCIINNK